MIKSFHDEQAERIFLREPAKRLGRHLQRLAPRKLMMVDAAAELEDLFLPPCNRLEKLSGDSPGQYSIRINDQWRVCFQWSDGDAYDVEIVDYH